MRYAVVGLALLVGCAQKTPVEAVPAITEQQVKQIVKDETAIARQEAKDSDSKLRSLLDAIKQETDAKIEREASSRKAEISKLAADMAKAEYESDVRVMATLDAKDLNRLVDVKLKMKNGQKLTDDELRIAARLNSLREFIAPEIEKRAKELGLSRDGVK